MMLSLSQRALVYGIHPRSRNIHTQVLMRMKTVSLQCHKDASYTFHPDQNHHASDLALHEDTEGGLLGTQCATSWNWDHWSLTSTVLSTVMAPLILHSQGLTHQPISTKSAGQHVIINDLLRQRPRTRRTLETDVHRSHRCTGHIFKSLCNI